MPFFIPVIRELQRRGHEVSLTARDAFQVCELANQKGMRYAKIGRHYGKNRMMKVLGLVWRSAQLLPFCMRKRPGLALSHGARSQMLLCNLLRIPTVLVLDYEHAKTPPLVRPRWEIVPDALPSGLQDFVDGVVPILQKRGIFRTDYEGATLREHLALARPDNAQLWRKSA